MCSSLSPSHSQDSTLAKPGKKGGGDVTVDSLQCPSLGRKEVVTSQGTITGPGFLELQKSHWSQRFEIC